MAATPSKGARDIASLTLSGVVVAVVAIVGLTAGGNDPYLLRLLSLSGIYAVLAIGLRIQLGELGELNLGHTVLFALGAYTFANLGLRWEVGGLLALALAACAAGVVATLVAALTLRLWGPFFAVATLGLVVVGTALILTGGEWTGELLGLGRFGGATLAKVPIVGTSGPTAMLLFIWFVVGVVVVGDHWLRASRFGSSLNAIRQDPVLFSSLGFDVARYRIVGAVVAGATAGLAGGMFAMYEGFVSISLVGLPLLGTTIVTVVAGGLQSPGGVLAAATIFTIGPEYARSLEDYRLIGFSVILLILVRLAPRGVGPMGLDPLARLIDRVRRGRGGAEPPARETEPASDEGLSRTTEMSAVSGTSTVAGPPA